MHVEEVNYKDHPWLKAIFDWLLDHPPLPSSIKS